MTNDMNYYVNAKLNCIQTVGAYFLHHFLSKCLCSYYLLFWRPNTYNNCHDLNHIIPASSSSSPQTPSNTPAEVCPLTSYQWAPARTFPPENHSAPYLCCTNSGTLRCGCFCRRIATVRETSSPCRMRCGKKSRFGMWSKWFCRYGGITKNGNFAAEKIAEERNGKNWPIFMFSNTQKWCPLSRFYPNCTSKNSTKPLQL